MSKKLVQINTVCNGSTGKIMLGIQEQAEKYGYEVYNFFGRGNAGNNRCFKICSKIDVYWHVLISRLFDMQGYGCKHATRKLVKKLKDINPDVIQLHNIHGYYINIKILFDYLEKCNAKIVWTLHDCWAFTGHCSYFTLEDCKKWIKQCKGCPNKKEYPKSIFVDRSYKNYIEKKNLFTKCKEITVITPSKWLANIVNESFLQKYDIKVINNGIDYSIFKCSSEKDKNRVRKKYNLDKYNKVILGVANEWDTRKGLNDFIYLSNIIDKDTIIFLVGLNTEQIKKLPSNIIGITRTDNINELVHIYSVADVFFNSSKEETFSLVTIEAIACGTPVIAYDNSAVKELINSKNGFLLKYENDINENCNEIIKYLYTINDKIHYTGIDMYSIEIMTNNYIKVYDKIE